MIIFIHLFHNFESFHSFYETTANSHDSVTVRCLGENSTFCDNRAPAASFLVSVVINICRFTRPAGLAYRSRAVILQSLAVAYHALLSQRNILCDPLGHDYFPGSLIVLLPRRGEPAARRLQSHQDANIFRRPNLTLQVGGADENVLIDVARGVSGIGVNTEYMGSFLRVVPARLHTVSTHEMKCNAAIQESGS